MDVDTKINKSFASTISSVRAALNSRDSKTGRDHLGDERGAGHHEVDGSSDDDRPLELDPTVTQRRALLVMFLLVTAIAAIVAGGHTYSIDNEVQLQTTRSLVQFQPELESVDSGWVNADPGPYRARVDGGHVAVVGIGQSLISTPFYLASRTVAQLLPANERDSFVRTGTFFTNSVVLGLLAVAVALLARELTPSFSAAFLTGLAYSLGTYALPHSKTFFTELTSALALTLGVVAAARFRRSGSAYQALACGALAGFGVLTRVSAGLFVPIFAIWIAVVAYRRSGPTGVIRSIGAFVVGGAPPLAAFLFFNWWRFGNAFDIGYETVPQSFPLKDGLYNVFFTPGKSLLLFAPFILLGIAGIVAGFRRHTSVLLLITSVVLANLVFFSRVPFWAGDAAWGPRYQQIIVPLLCAPAAVLAGRRWWPTTFGLLTAIGVLLPSVLGTLIYFNVFFIQADNDGAPFGAITETMEWQPFLGHLELVPIGVRDVFDANHPDENERGPYSQDPFTHYGYFGWEPRIDFWWLWVEPTGSSPLLYVFFVPIVAALGSAALIATGRLRLPRLTAVGLRPRFDRGQFAADDDEPTEVDLPLDCSGRPPVELRQ